MKSIMIELYSIKDAMPPQDKEYRIVRCINNHHSEFYFMAYFDCDADEWEFFDEGDIYKPEETRSNTMKVTHWGNMPEIPFRNKDFYTSDANSL